MPTLKKYKEDNPSSLCGQMPINKKPGINYSMFLLIQLLLFLTQEKERDIQFIPRKLLSNKYKKRQKKLLEEMLNLQI